MMKLVALTLDGVRIKTLDRTHCDVDCPLLTYSNGTVCSLERLNTKRKSRYDGYAEEWKRCPACLRLERKS